MQHIGKLNTAVQSSSAQGGKPGDFLLPWVAMSHDNDGMLLKATLPLTIAYENLTLSLEMPTAASRVLSLPSSVHRL